MRNFQSIIIIGMAGIFALLAGSCKKDDTGDNPDNNIDTLPNSPPANYYLVGYFPNWLSGGLQANDITAKRLTHINYAFAVITGNALASTQSTQDAMILNTLNQWKTLNPSLKILISVGGWTGSGGFSNMVYTASNRKNFIKSAITFIETNNIDGIDFDWEYPGMPGNGNTYRAEDKENFTLLLKEMRESLDSLETVHSKDYAITIAAGATKECLSHLEMDKIPQYLDFISIMTYDFYGSWSSTTGHHTNLYSSSYEPGGSSADSSVHWFINAGAPSNKIVIGSAFYAKGWTGVTNTNNGLYQAYSGSANEYTYYQLVQTKINRSGFTRYWDESAKAPYLWNVSTQSFITYDDPESVKNKCEYIETNNLGGISFWQYFGDYNNELVNTMRYNLE